MSEVEARLKRKVAEGLGALANSQSEKAELVRELKELNATRRELEHKVNVQTDKALHSEAALFKKTEEYKVCANLKANLETTLLASEKDLKLANVEIKRLEHQFDVSTAKVATLQAENTRLVQAAATKPTSRTSISTSTERPTNRFGYNSTSSAAATATPLVPVSAPSGIRPRSSSAQGNYPIANSSRRSSISSSSIPTLKPNGVGASPLDTARINSLEREVSDGKSRNEVLEKEVVGLKTKLSNKERELLTMENKLMASEREQKVLAEELGEKLEDAMDEVKEGRSELGKAKEKMRVEMISLTNLMGSDKKSFEDKMDRMKAEVEKRELQLEKSDLKREEVEMKLADLSGELKGSKGNDNQAIERLQAEKLQVEQSLAQVTELLQVETGKTMSMEESLEKVKSSLEEAKSGSSDLIATLQSERDELASQVAKAEVDFALVKIAIEEVNQEQSKEIVSLRGNLEVSFATVEALERTMEGEADAAITELRSQLTAKDLELTQLSSENSTLSKAKLELETLPAILLLSQESLASTQLEKEELTSTLASMEEKVSQLTLALVDFKEVNATLEELRISHQEATRLAETQEVEMKELESRFELSVAQVEELSRQVAELESLPKRSFDDSEVESLQLQLGASRNQVVAVEEIVAALEKEIEAKEAVATESNERKLLAQSDVVALEGIAAELRERLESALETANDEIMKASNEASEYLVELEEARSSISILEHQLSTETSTLEEIKTRHTDLENKFEGAQLSIQELELVPGELRSSQVELESLRLAREEDSNSHLVELGTLNTRVVEQQEAISTLNELTVRLTASLEEAEKKVVQIGEEVIAAKEELHRQGEIHTSASDEADNNLRISGEELASVKKEMKEELEQVSRSLEEAEEGVLVAEKGLLQVEESLQATNLKLETATSHAGIAATEITRLAKELDILTGQLENSEESLATLQSSLNSVSSSTLIADQSSTTDSSLDTTRQVILVTRLREERDHLWSQLNFSKTEAQFRIESLQERLILLEGGNEIEVKELEDRLSSAVEEKEKVLAKATGEVEGLEKDLMMAREELREAEAKMVEFDQLSVQVSSLEATLELVTSEAEQLRTQLSTATAMTIELQSGLDATASTSDSDEVTALQSKISELEFEKSELQEKILRRTQQIAENDQTIGLLITNQLVVDDQDDTAEIPSAPSTDSIEKELASTFASLQSEIISREEAQGQLEVVTAELVSTRQELVAAEVAAQDQLQSHQTAFGELEAEHSATKATLEILEARSTDSDQQYLADRAILAEALQHKTMDVAKALEKLASIEASALLLSQTRGAAGESIEKIKKLELDLTASVSELETATRELKQSQEEVQQLQLDLEKMESEVLHLRTTVAGHEEEMDTAAEEIEALALELEASTAAERKQSEEIENLNVNVQNKANDFAQLKALHAQVEQQLDLLQADLSKTVSEHAAFTNESQHLTAELEADLNNARLEFSAALEERNEIERVIRNEIEVLKDEVAGVNEEREHLAREIAATRDSLEDSRHEVNRLSELVETSNSEFDALRTEARKIEIELEEEQAKSTNRNSDLLERLEHLQIGKSEVEAQLMDANDRISSSSVTSPSNDQVQELQRQLDEKNKEVEETDEKYIEVLRNQKRNLAQIERLRARCEGLQRDLTSLKQAVPLPTASESLPTEVAATITPSIKRRRPAEFDPTPSAPLPPRAVVATRTPSKVNRQEQENVGIVNLSRTGSPTKASGKKEVRSLKTIDGLVPTKAEAPSSPRKVLGTVQPNPMIAKEKKTEELRARLAGMRRQQKIV